VLELALTYHLVSPYTSLVAVDVTLVRPGDQLLESHALKTNLPDGWDYTAVFGLGQGATDAPVHVMLGLVACVLAAALAAAARRARHPRKI
jgi:Ca-activated chloride channel family protein